MDLFENLMFTKEGAVFYKVSMKPLTVNSRGYFTYKGIKHNLAKCLMKCFKDIDIKSGRVIHLDGDRENFSIENIEYASKQKKALKPSENDLLEMLDFYFILPNNFSIKDFFAFRIALSIINDYVKALEKVNDPIAFKVIYDYLNCDFKSIYRLSKIHQITINDCKQIINNFQNALVEESKILKSKISLPKSPFLLNGKNYKNTNKNHLDNL